MDARTLRDNFIKPKLLEMFGATMGLTLLTVGISASMKGKTEPERIQYMVEAICSDKRVVGMWGAARAQQQKNEWLRSA